MSESLSGLQTLGRRFDWRPLKLDPPGTLDQVSTPVLIVDRLALQRNLQRMCEHAARHGVGLRPHTKTHKCPIIAHQQLEMGAVGICVAKVSEAEVMRSAGIERILVTSPVVAPGRVAALVDLMARSEQIMVVVDSLLGLERLAAAARARGVVASVLIDIDPDMGRTGVPRRLEAVLGFAEQIVTTEGVALRGIQHYCGQVMHVAGHAERAAESCRHWEACLEIRAEVERRGIELEIVTGGGTGTFDIDARIDGITDLQVGSYIFMDQEYLDIGGEQGDVFDAFEPALFVETTAISAPREGGVTLDGGFKSLASDTVNPTPVGLPGAKFYFGGDEHGILRTRGANRVPGLGERVRLLTPHCDPTVNLYDNYVVIANDRVDAIWPIAARGCSW